MVPDDLVHRIIELIPLRPGFADGLCSSLRWFPGPQHLEQDLASPDLALSPEAVRAIEFLGGWPGHPHHAPVSTLAPSIVSNQRAAH